MNGDGIYPCILILILMLYNLPVDSVGGTDQDIALGWEVWCWERRDYCNDHIWQSQCPAASCMESRPKQLNSGRNHENLMWVHHKI
jgi:hypothetical protein